MAKGLFQLSRTSSLLNMAPDRSAQLGVLSYCSSIGGFCTHVCKISIGRIFAAFSPFAILKLEKGILKPQQMICGASKPLTVISLHNIMSEDSLQKKYILQKSSDPMEYIKNPMVAEFMGFHRDNNYSESQLEQAFVDNLEKFYYCLKRLRTVLECGTVRSVIIQMPYL